MNKTLSSFAGLFFVTLTFLASCKTSSLNLKESHTQHVGVNAEPATAVPTWEGPQPTPTYLPGTPAGASQFVRKIADAINTGISSSNAIALKVGVTIAIRSGMDQYKGFIEIGINKWLAAIRDVAVSAPSISARPWLANLSSLSVAIFWIDVDYDIENYANPNESFWHSALCNRTAENSDLRDSYDLFIFVVDINDMPPNCVLAGDVQFPAHDTALGRAGIGLDFFVLNLARARRMYVELGITNTNPLPEGGIRYTIEHELGHTLGVQHLEERQYVDPSGVVTIGADFCRWNGEQQLNYRKYLMCGDPPNTSTDYVTLEVKRDPSVSAYNLPLSEFEKSEAWAYLSQFLSATP